MLDTLKSRSIEKENQFHIILTTNENIDEKIVIVISGHCCCISSFSDWTSEAEPSLYTNKHSSRSTRLNVSVVIDTHTRTNEPYTPERGKRGGLRWEIRWTFESSMARSLSMSNKCQIRRWGYCYIDRGYVFFFIWLLKKKILSVGKSQA